MHVETNALLVIQGLNNSSLDFCFDLVHEDIHVIANDFHKINFSFVKRFANTAAYLVSREVVSVVDCRVWFDSPPSFLSVVLSSDIN